MTVGEFGCVGTMVLDASLAVAALAPLALGFGVHSWRFLVVLLGAGISVIGIDVSTRDLTSGARVSHIKVTNAASGSPAPCVAPRKMPSRCGPRGVINASSESVTMTVGFHPELTPA